MPLSKTVLNDTEKVFGLYQSVRHRLPEAAFPERSEYISSVSELAGSFDVFLFDAFGVLNLGDRPIMGAAEMLADLKAAGKHIYIITNASSFTKGYTLKKYLSMGFELNEKSVITSRDILLENISEETGTIGLISGFRETSDMPGRKIIFSGEAGFEDADIFIFADSAGWNQADQADWISSLKAEPRPVYVANPDITAPRGHCFSAEPGYFTLTAEEDVFEQMRFFGKPFIDIYSHAFEKISAETGLTDRSRMLMTGDTLHTDIIGGASSGVKTLLLTSYGFFAGRNIKPYIRKSGIVPDYILTGY